MFVPAKHFGQMSALCVLIDRCQTVEATETNEDVMPCFYPPVRLFIYEQVKWDSESSMCCFGDLMSTCLLAVP